MLTRVYLIKVHRANISIETPVAGNIPFGRYKFIYFHAQNMTKANPWFHNMHFSCSIQYRSSVCKSAFVQECGGVLDGCVFVR